MSEREPGRAVPVTLLRMRRHVDFCRTATALCRDSRSYRTVPTAHPAQL